MHDSNRAGAHDQDHLSRLYPDRILPAQDASERLDQRLNGRVNLLTYRHHVPLSDRLGGHSHILGKATVQSDAKRVVVCTQVVVARDALPAVSASHVRRDKHLLPAGEALDGRANLGNRPHHFVAWDPDRSRRILPVGTLKNPQVGAANAGAFDAQQDLARADTWFGHLLHAQVSGTVIDSG